MISFFVIRLNSRGETSDSGLESDTPGCSEIRHIRLILRNMLFVLFLVLERQSQGPTWPLNVYRCRNNTFELLKKRQWERLAFPPKTWEPGFPGMLPASRNGLEGVLQVDRKTSRQKVCKDSAVCVLRICWESGELFMGTSFFICITASYYSGKPYSKAGVPSSLVPL